MKNSLYKRAMRKATKNNTDVQVELQKIHRSEAWLAALIGLIIGVLGTITYNFIG